MGKVIAEVHIMPVGVDTNLEEIISTMKTVVPEKTVLKDSKIEPVAFGLKKVRARIRYPEEWGGTDKLEEIIKGLDGLQGVEGIAFSKA